MTPALSANGDDFPPLGTESSTIVGQSNGQSPAKRRPSKQKSEQPTIAEARSLCPAKVWRGKRLEGKIRPYGTEDLDEDGGGGTTGVEYGERFVTRAVGSRLGDFRLDFYDIFEQRQVGSLSDFILIPIAPVRENSWNLTDNFEAVADDLLHTTDWSKRIAVDLGQPNLDTFNPVLTKKFDRLFRHALYLSPPVIVIDCPESDLAITTCASLTNDHLMSSSFVPLILFRVSMDCAGYKSKPSSWITNSPDTSAEHQLTHGHDKQNLTTTGVEGHKNLGFDDDDSLTSCSSRSDEDESLLMEQEPDECGYSCPWRQWNSIRSHLLPYKQIGVCLTIRDDLSGTQADLDRWTGEPVRMIIISVDQFVRTPGSNSRLHLTSKSEAFIKKVVQANSLKTSLVIEARAEQDLAEHMQYLRNIVDELEPADPNRCWNDRIQPPLQPLSSNLNSGTYAAFEMDTIKYALYRDAQIEALRRLLKTNQDVEERKTFVLMVLGAGRGPLVDKFIEAIRAVNSKHKFKIYALDKNPSSIRSLRYKQKYKWTDKADQFETVVVESDMREWNPNLKADIIATELLGSFSDNELSPECIDGLWTISTPQTICIPQNYSSYLAPICSYKQYQEVHKLTKARNRFPFDEIYVSKLSNCYLISRPQELFHFDHHDLTIPAEQKCNERFKSLTFWSETDTVCHGFAGYFSAHLFGTTHMSIVEGTGTPGMESWFPAFIPLEEPIQLAKNSRLEVMFWRKESLSGVWYEWTVVKPIRSRIYSQSGTNTFMSKLIQ